jgi:hypothetical protein
MEISSTQLAPAFTITAWIYVTGNSNLFSIQRSTPESADAENVLNFGDTEDKLYFAYSDGVTEYTNYTSNVAYTFNDWFLAALTVEWDKTDKKSAVKIYTNN